MNTQENLLNSEAQKCSFCEDDIENMCSNKEHDTCGDRGTRSFAELKELFAGNGMVGFVAKERVDGKLILAEAVKLLKMATA